MDSTTQTLIGVALGAVLATLGGFVATQAAAGIDQRRQRRAAALMVGEVLAAIEVVLALVEQRDLQRPPVVVSFLKQVQGEIDIYQRNREQLFHLTDPALRALVHGFMLRLAVPISGAVEALTALELEADEMLRASHLANAQRSLAFLSASKANIPKMMLTLGPLAGAEISRYPDIAHYVAEAERVIAGVEAPAEDA